MKKIFVFFAIFLMSIMAASAQLTLTDVTLGSDTQERDENTTATLTLTNTGTLAVTAISLSSNAGAEYTVSFSPATVATLAAGASTAVTVEGFVPLDQDAGVDSLGTITATATYNASSTTATSALYMETENNLIIKDIEVIVNDDDENVDDGDDVKVFPFADVEMVIEIKNTHSDINIEDIEITVQGEDDLDDIDEDDDMSKLKDGDKDTFTFTFEIDEDAEDGDYDIVIEISGEDEEGAVHGEEWTINFELDEEGIFITKAVMVPETLVCGEDSFDLRLELANVGTRDEDEVAVEIIADSLDFEKRVSNLEIDEDDEITKTYEVSVPKDAAAGSHVIELRAFMDFDEKTHTKYVYFTVPSGCSDVADEEEEEEEEADDGIVINTDDDDEEEEVEFIDVSDGEERTSTSLSFDNGIWATVLLVLANILIVVIIVILIVRFLVRN